jgi:repressor LexA
MTVAEIENAPQGALTDRQREIYDWIVTWCEQRGYAPTVRELAKAFEFSSPNGAYCHLSALAKKGWITWVPNVCRTIRPIGGVR